MEKRYPGTMAQMGAIAAAGLGGVGRMPIIQPIRPRSKETEREIAIRRVMESCPGITAQEAADKLNAMHQQKEATTPHRLPPLSLAKRKQRLDRILKRKRKK